MKNQKERQKGKSSSKMEGIELKTIISKNISGNRGITLIALVVTIVVLIILATISISVILGDNGLIARAEKARQVAENADIKTGEDLDELEKLLGTVLSESNKGQIVTDGNAEYIDASGKAVIPKGFCVVNGANNTIANGLVISDVAGDDLANSKGGNQFVWVPVDGTTLKYEKHAYATATADDHKGSTADTGNGGWKTYQYRNYTGWTDNGGNAASVAKYKGFYIARYEAGIPEEADFYSNAKDTPYYQQTLSDNSKGTNAQGEAGDYANTYKVKNATTYKPVSKKNTPSWNYISQVNAKTVAGKMYEGSTSVTSSLIDGYAWDTVTQWLSDSGKNVTDSKEWGNYYNTSFEVNDIYAIHEWKTGTDGKDRWYPAYRWNGGKYTRPNNARVEVPTGSIERNMAKNIYDFAGNMHEWTTEQRTGTRTDWNSTTSTDTATTEQTFAVLRGGSFDNSSNANPASYRHGYDSAATCSVSFGFRVTLYIK